MLRPKQTKFKKYRKITVLNNNQDIIDKSSTIILGVTPNVGSKILHGLEFFLIFR